jgi:hypothetical protein
MMEGFIDMWQAANFLLTEHGWRVWFVAPVLAYRKPVVVTHGNILQIQAVLNQPIRVGNFCKRPHTYIDFDNSYERKESLQGS